MLLHLRFQRPLNRLAALCPALAAALLVACAGVQPQSDPNEYINASDYDRLKLVSTQPGVKIYRYLSPDYKRSDYRAVMVDPIVLYQSAEKDLGKKGITEETIPTVESFENSAEVETRFALESIRKNVATAGKFVMDLLRKAYEFFKNLIMQFFDRATKARKIIGQLRHWHVGRHCGVGERLERSLDRFHADVGTGQ